MEQPLSKAQQNLRGRKISDMSLEQLRDWIDACHRMEEWKHTPAKARRDWKESRQEAELEIAKRGSGSDAACNPHG